MNLDNPLIVQGDRTLMLETMHQRFEEVRDRLLSFSELIRRPEYLHTYRITSLSLWNAASAGVTAEQITQVLLDNAKYPVPEGVIDYIDETFHRYGALRLVGDGEHLKLLGEPSLLDEIKLYKSVADLLGPRDGEGFQIHRGHRGQIKQLLLACNQPVKDEVGFEDGDELTIKLNTEGQEPFCLRPYQLDAVSAFCAGSDGGSGVVVLPCGAGKTLVAIATMAQFSMNTLILCTGHTALQQWKREILKRTNLVESQVAEFSSKDRSVAPVTLTTYQMLTHRRKGEVVSSWFRLFHEVNWGLIVYDEVHLLPAPIFRETAYVQARRRLGLTATLVREDGKEGDVFALIGPKKFDLPWKTLEHQGWIATATCVEVRVDFSAPDRHRYVVASKRNRSMMAAKNVAKLPVIAQLLARHNNEQILILGTYIDQLRWISRTLQLPVITGKTKMADRDLLFDQFRRGEISTLILSKVGNFAIDLPEASVAIQVSGTFGSRQEEAQRLGRVLRVGSDGRQSTFYTLVTADSREQDFAEHRQLFLAEQGYPYRIERLS